ncbi:MAG: ABC transporter permease [Bryobacterales bacterium]|nr:ABC transporter permease [Bryobacterales bacterium]
MTFVQDVRFALRVFRGNPEFTAVAVLTLALGIGGNTALFSLADQLLLRDLPVRDSKRLITLTWSTPRFKDQPNCSIRDYEAFQRATQVLSDVAATRVFQRFTVEANGVPEIASGEYVSGNYFSMLGIQPLLGRVIEPADDANGSGSVAVLSYGAWRRRFGGDPAVIGKMIRVDSRPMTIIGVTPPRFYGLNPGYTPEFRLPLSGQPAPVNERQRQVDSAVIVIGRLRQGVSRVQAEAYLRPLYAAREQEKAQFLPEAQPAGFSPEMWFWK